ncbi:MAG: response regulator, partial [Bacteroidales bacterium]|nr:response regulator [Bacteroidales bacterium]
MIKVLVVDDHHLIRLGLCGLLREVPTVGDISEAASGEEALEKVRAEAPDVVLMDIRMPGMGGLEATRRIVHNHEPVKVIVVTAFNNDVYPNKLLKAGAAGYITKNADGREIAQAITMVMAGSVYVSPSIAQQMVVSGL